MLEIDDVMSAMVDTTNTDLQRKIIKVIERKWYCFDLIVLAMHVLELSHWLRVGEKFLCDNDKLSSLDASYFESCCNVVRV